MVNSFVWTDEEAKYFKAVLKWKEKEAAPTSLNSDDTSSSKPEGNNGISQQHSDRRTEQETEPSQQKPAAAGELRILVIGAKGTGKTSILTRFATNTFPEPPDPFYSRGCRHRIELDAFTLPPGGQGQPHAPQGLDEESPMSPTTTKQTQNQNQNQQQQKRVYIVDALELPSQHIPSDPMLEQALNLTEAAVLVYDVADAKSLQLVLGIAEFVKEYLDRQNGIINNPAGAGSGNGSGNGNGHYPRRREFPLILVGNKSDISAEPQADDMDDTGPNDETHQTDEKETTAMIGPVPFIKVSAKTGYNINFIFPMLAREILRCRWLFEQREQPQQ
ncbi:ras-related and estrogen-regulated growth inhibitor-like protein, partial [Rhypophila decipiens]